MHDVRLDAASDSTAKAELSAGWPVLLAATLGCGAGLSSLPFYSLGICRNDVRGHPQVFQKVC
jgi:hypothetical protein